MPFNPYGVTPSRYSRTFDVRNQNAHINPFFFMAAATTGVAGDVLKYSTEDTVTIAGSGVTQYQVAGFLMQEVKDLDGGAIKGYRNLNNTVENLGGNIGVLQSNELADTKRYVGTLAVGDVLTTAENGTGQLAKYHATNNTGHPLAIVEAITSSVTPSIEPTQFGTTSTDFIRIRIVGL